MLTKFTLPPEYDVYSPVTRLWLQSRLKPPKAVQTDKTNGGSVPNDHVNVRNGTTTKASSQSPKVGGKAPEPVSDTQDYPFVPHCTIRPWTVSNTLVSLDLARMILPHYQLIFRPEYKSLIPLVSIYIVEQLFGGFGDAASLWAEGHLLSTVEQSLLSGQAVPWRHAAWSAGVSVSLAALKTLSRDFVFKNKQALDSRLKFHFQRVHLRLSLMETVEQMNDKVRSEMLEEAGILAGLHLPMEHMGGGGYAMVRTSHLEIVGLFVHVLRNLVKVCSCIWLLRHTLPNTFRDRGVFGVVAMLCLPVVMMMARGGWADVKKYFSGEARRGLDVSTINPFGERLKALKVMVNRDGEEVRLFGLGDWILRQWETATLGSMEWERQRLIPMGSFLESGQLYTFINIALQAAISTKMIDSVISFSQLAIHNQSVTMVLHAVLDLWKSIDNARHATYWMGAFLAVLECQSEEQRLGVDYDKRREARGMRISVRDLSVTYPPHTTPALQGIDLDIGAGETLALVGPNGGGKTTLAKALMGVHQFSGKILINDLPMGDYTPSSLHARMSGIFQDFRRYPLTLGQNVGLGDVSRIDDTSALLEAMHHGGADVLLDQKFTLDTKLRMGNAPKRGIDPSDEKWAFHGIPLSGGQWQRVALARAFMRAETADLVVFDEPSAALDPGAEAELFDRIYDMAHREGGRTTTIFISHGFGNVRRADHIAFVAGGTITEYGTHAELMAKGGEYARLFTLQSRGYVGSVSTEVVAST